MKQITEEKDFEEEKVQLLQLVEHLEYQMERMEFQENQQKQIQQIFQNKQIQSDLQLKVKIKELDNHKENLEFQRLKNKNIQYYKEMGKQLQLFEKEDDFGTKYQNLQQEIETLENQIQSNTKNYTDNVNIIESLVSQKGIENIQIRRINLIILNLLMRLTRKCYQLFKRAKVRFSEQKSKPADDEKIYDEEEQYQENQGFTYYKGLKYGIFGSVSFLIYINGRYVINNEFDSELASTETFYQKNVFSFTKYIIEKSQKFYVYLRYPPLQKFLPDQLPLPRQMQRKTLVINIDGILLSKDFKNGEGTQIHLRPGFRKFIKRIAQKYEIVVFSRQDTNFLREIVRTIDPMNMTFPFIFGNEFLITEYNGLYQDLKYLNRNLKDVIVLDYQTENYMSNNNNVIKMDQYNGESDDCQLRDISHLLDHLSQPRVKDVRREIKKFGGFENCLENHQKIIKKKYEKFQQKKQYFKKSPEWKKNQLNFNYRSIVD